MMKFNIIIVRIALCLTVLLNRRECVNVKCEKFYSNGVAIKDFQGEMNLKRDFRFCSNEHAVILTFKYCKVEQFIIPTNQLKIYYPKVGTIVWQCSGKCLIEENEDIVNLYGCEKGKLFIYLFIYLYFFHIDIQGTSFEDDELDFMISPSPDQIFRKNKIVCIVYCWKLEITIKLKTKKTNKLLHTFFCISYSISFLCPSISVPKMEQVTDDSRLDHSTDSQMSDVGTYPSSSKQKY